MRVSCESESSPDISGALMSLFGEGVHIFSAFNIHHMPFDRQNSWPMHVYKLLFFTYPYKIVPSVQSPPPFPS